ncbi:hypothetical protein ACFQHO_10625 [Actinomadura yumaensis]|uniref:hypothetical protein n=1 Tax=Actinomadura yumaensis TaxID=111807 RepID=UPI00361DD59B
MLDQIPEDLVAQLAQFPDEVPGLAQAEQQGRAGSDRRNAEIPAPSSGRAMSLMSMP